MLRAKAGTFLSVAPPRGGCGRRLGAAMRRLSAHAAAPGRREAGDQDPQESWMSVRAAELAVPKSVWVLTFSHGTKKVEFQ